MNVILILCDTLRRDHVGAYTGGRPLNECWSKEAPEWAVPTPNMDRLAGRGVTFDNCHTGSTPCMPARRDIYTGRLEFLERGWGPLDEDDLDLPRQVSGTPNMSVTKMMAEGDNISYLITDHFHLWEQGACNYHVGYSGFDFVRGCEADGLYTAPIEFDCPPGERMRKVERHWRNVHYIRQSDDDYFCAQVFDRASAWVDRNKEHEDFYLHLDIFDPHEPWDPPEELLKQFDPKGYAVGDQRSFADYAPWKGNLTEEEFNNLRARYAAKVAFLDDRLGRLMDTLDRNDMWKDTMVILTTDHGTFNGDHGRMGKLQTHEFDAKSHIPLIVTHPTLSHGEHRDQLVQLVDLYPTVLAALGKPIPELPEEKPLHGINLLPVIEAASATTRDYALCGMFGGSTTITDGEWTLHQAPVEDNQPLLWHGYNKAWFIHYDLGPYENGVRKVSNRLWFGDETWLSHKASDPNELRNLAAENPDKLHEMQCALHAELARLKAPEEQAKRLGLLNTQ
jgi:arylsulfatase A-like enzyme